jgi:hypothetical protein
VSISAGVELGVLGTVVSWKIWVRRTDRRLVREYTAEEYSLRSRRNRRTVHIELYGWIEIQRLHQRRHFRGWSLIVSATCGCKKGDSGSQNDKRTIHGQAPFQWLIRGCIYALSLLLWSFVNLFQFADSFAANVQRLLKTREPTEGRRRGFHRPSRAFPFIARGDQRRSSAAPQ